MSKLIDLVVSASALIFLISAGLLYADSQEELERELDEAEDGGPDEVEKILIRYNDRDRDSIKVDGHSLNEIRSYKFNLCDELKLMLALRPIIENEFQPKNRGVSKFINHYKPIALESCQNNFYWILEAAVKQLPHDARQFVDGLNTVDRSTLSNEEKNKRFSKCLELIHGLSHVMWFLKYITVEFHQDHFKAVEEWFNIFEACKEHAKQECDEESKLDESSSINKILVCSSPEYVEKFLPMERPQILRKESSSLITSSNVI